MVVFLSVHVSQVYRAKKPQYNPVLYTMHVSLNLCQKLIHKQVLQAIRRYNITDKSLRRG